MPAPMITTRLRTGGPLGRCLNEQACLPSKEAEPSEGGGCSAIVLTASGCDAKEAPAGEIKCPSKACALWRAAEPTHLPQGATLAHTPWPPIFAHPWLVSFQFTLQPASCAYHTLK